jgi:acid phosphatase family membrane protein YuiD
MFREIQPFVNNRALVVPLVAWCLAQVLKVMISSLKQRRLDLSLLLSSGGMPSSHAALVCALATVVGLTDGIHSNIFALAAFFAAIVMYDAAGVRLAVSRQARILNRMVDEFYEGKPHIEKHLIELIGHTRIEVLAGAIFGIILAFYWT